MSISFNGLASGLDTSSWITSLTALKQAKVTTLQQQREELVVSKNTLSSIRSFFTSFRSTLEKITDSRFNIVSMNLFAQNLATSANLNVLSATATSEAEEGKYEVKVDKVATNTQAVSKHKYTALVDKTKLADKSSTLVSIGANEGSFTINLDGDIKTINITSDTTIGSLISTLKGYGIDAEFNEKTGIFSADIDADDITENGTNIKNALHLVSQNKGYFSSDLTYNKVDENAYSVANESTLIWDIQGMNPAAKEMVDDRDDINDENNRTLTLTAGGESFYVYLDDDETIGSLVNDINNDAEMQAKGVVASFENGVFKLVNAVISGVGQTGFDEAFGMDDNISTNIVQKSENLSYEAPVHIYKSASLDSKLVDLNTGIKLNDGDTIEVMDANGVATTITMSDDMTIGDLFAEMEAAGLEITLNDNDTVDLTSGVVTGGTYDVLNALGLRDGGVLREKTIQVVGSTINEDTTLGAMGISGTLTIYNEDDSVHETITIDANSEMTMGEFLAELESKGITSATLTDGVITLNSDDNRYVAGDLATALGIDVIGTTNESSTLAVTYTQKLTATEETKLVDVDALESIFNGNPATTAKIFVYDSNGTQVNTISITGSESLDNLVAKLDTAGFEAEFESGRISLTSTNGNYLGGAVASALGLNAVRTTVANSITSDTPVIYEKTYDVTSTIGISQTSTRQITQHANTDSLTALSAVTSSDMVLGRTYKISTTADLEKLATIVNGGKTCSGVTFVLANDIDLSSIANWTAIGNLSTKFSGTFDGNGYEISGFSIDSSSGYQGLFGYTSGATIKNLGLTGVDIISTGANVGALVGCAYNSTIQNVYTEGSVSGSGYVGGLVGYANGSTLTSCQASGTVVGSNSNVGGLVGYISGTIISSSSSANVSGVGQVGGIAGYAYSATLISVYSTGTLDDTDNSNEHYIGGLVGYSSAGLTIQDSWTKATVESGGGSVVGYVSSGTALISNTQATSTNYYASIYSSATGTTSGCSAADWFTNPFTINPRKLVSCFTSYSNISLNEVGLNGTYSITVSNEGTLTTLTISSTDSLSRFEQQLESAGLSVGISYSTVSDGPLLFNKDVLNGVTISGTEGVYIVGNLDSRLEKAFNLEDKGTAIATTKASTTTINTTLTEDTTFAELGFDNSGNKISYTLYSANGSEIATYSHSSQLKVEEFLSVLNSNGFTAEIVDGRLSIESNGGNYIKSDSLDKFNITEPAYTVYSANAENDYKTFGTTATSTVAIVASAMITVGVSQTSSSKIELYTDTTNLTALSAVTASDMVSGRTYKISTTADLEALATIVNGGTNCSGVTFVMSNDIDLSSIANWTAIGNDSTRFSGIFDGNGYEISGLSIDSTSDYQGLFGYTRGATIKNLGLTGVNVTSTTNYVGALVGSAANSTIQNVYTEGYVSGLGYVGGLVGDAYGSTITSCQASGTVVGSNSSVGGLVGYFKGTITSSSSSANVSGKSYVGGIVGAAIDATLISVYSTGTLDDTDNTDVYRTGGLVGISSNLTIQDSWTKATVESGGGSVVGYVQSGTALISNTKALSDNYYASITVTATGTISGCSASSSFTNPFTVTTTAYATSATKMSEIGLTDTRYITVIQNGTESTITVSTTTTIDNLCSSLKSKGIYAKIEDGKITISGDGNSYIKGELDDKLDNIFNLADLARTYTVIPNNTTTKGVTYTSGSKIEQYTDTTNLTALSAVTSSSMVSGRTYKISTTEDLEALATIVNGGTSCSGVTFVMSNDIDLSSIANWTAIGNISTNFSGTFDGNGYEISGLRIDSTSSYQGLFGGTNGATIKNLGLTGVDIISTGSLVGALVGYARNSTIQNVYTEGTVSGDGVVGGLVGGVNASTLTSCQASGTVVGSGTYVGGLVGQMSGTITSSSSSSAKVSGKGNVGGIAGYAYVATLISVYSTGTLDDTDNTGVYKTGGLVGYSDGALTIQDSWTKASVESGGGSVVGYLGGDTTLISNIKATSSNYYASIASGATGTTSGCSASSSFSNPFTVTTTAYATSAFKMSQIGLSETKYITVIQNGTESTITVEATTTISELCSSLQGKGFTASFTNGRISIAGAANAYIKGRLDDELRDVLNLNDPSSIYTYVQKTNTNQGVTFTSTAELEKTTSTYNLTALSAVTAPEVVSGATFKISTTEDLQALATLVNNGNTCAGVTFVMENDIDLSSIANWTAIGGVNGTTTCTFSGTFDGNGYEISGLSIDSTSNYQGLFGCTDGATIKNLGLTGVNVTSTTGYVGALVGSVRNSTIKNVYTAGTVSGTGSYVGGLVGYAYQSTITSCQASGTVVGSLSNVGGLVGYISSGTITSSSSSANVSGKGYVGGIAGYANGATLISVYSTGTLDDTDNTEVYRTGGLVGYSITGLTIRDSWTKASVESGGGSVVGYAYSGTALISNTKALSDNYYASIRSGAIGTTSGCSASATFDDPFTFDIGVNKYATIHTSLGQLGLTSTRYVTINNSGTTYKCTVTSSTTLGDFINDLKSKGLDVEYEDYKLTIRQGNAYIVGELDDELDDIFNFDNVYTSNAIENVTESDATLDELIQAKYGSDWASWRGNSEIEIYNNGATTTIDLSTIKGSTTTGQFFDILESAGLTCSISNGIVSISGGEDVYISSDRDKKLADLFGFSGNYTSVQVTSSYSGKFNSVDVAKTMAESTTLGELADRVITQNVAQEVTNLSKNVSSLTALSAVTASDIVSGRTYKISTTADLEALATFVNTNAKTCSGVTFVLANDIDLSSIANWTAIGNIATRFSGTFDGNGYEISGLRINSSSDYQGLFGYTYGATIKNLGLTGVAVISTGARVGALVGHAEGSTIENVYTEGTVSGSGYVGGLVGSVSSSTLTSCQASGTAAGKSNWAGGLLGVAYNATIAASSSDTNVSAQSQLGGIVGYTSNVKLISVYSTGTLDDIDNLSVYYTGGLVGRSANGLTIQDSWTKATVESGGGSVVGYVGGGTALISNTKALSDNYYASITVAATGTTDNCSTITADETPFTVQAKKVHAPTDTFAEVGLTENVTLTVVQNGTETTITVTPTTDFGTLMSRLVNAGLSVGYNSIQGTDTAYLKGQVDPRLAEILGLEKQGASTITAINQVGQTVSATFTSEDTVGAISTWLRDNLGARVNIVDGKISISTNPNGPARILDASNDLDELLKLDGDLQDVTNSESSVHRTGTTIMETLTISEGTYLSDLGVTEGEFYLYSNGVKNVIQVTKDDTIGSLMQTLTSHGIDSEIVVSGENSYFKIFGDDDNYLEASTSPDNASNIMEILFPIKETEPSCYSNTLKVPETNASQEIATEDTLVSAFDKNGNTSAGVLEFNYDGNDYKITITSDDTFGTLIEKFEEVGVSASIYDGRLVLNSTDKIFSIYGHSDSNLASNLGLNYTTVLENTTSSTSEIESKYQENEVIEASAAQYADADTKLSMLGISSGSLSIYRAGEKAQVNVDADGTFATLQSSIKAAFTDVDLRFTNGYLEIYSTTGGVTIEVGATTDTSNIVAITGLSNKGELSATSSRELYKVNGDSKLTEADIFKRGDVTEGTFIIGNAEFTIDDKTTLNNIIGQINSSAEANATAYWDAVDGKFVIKSRVSGATFVNIEAGTSNFTDILGFTITERDGDGNITSTKLNVDTQEVGGNAQFSINGTNYTSTSNIVGSDVTKIKGLTLDLKGTSNGETVTVTVEKDYNTAADAMQEVVDAYNALIENVDKEVAMDGDLNDESTLKLLRNQIRSLMMGSIGGSSPYRMLSSIGISTESASASNISTTTINKLEFNKDKFIEAFRADTKAVENLLVGNGTQQGILTKVENVVENAVKAVTGYFSTAENSYTQQINRLDSKIEKANAAVAAYKSRLEQKFQYMDMMIAKMQDQFSTFLGT